MTVRDALLQLGALFCLSCGDPPQGSGSQSGSSTGSGDTGVAGSGATMASTGPSTTDQSSTGPGIDPACPEVHEGTLTINGSTNTLSLRLIGRVTGDLIVDGFDGTSLDFLQCLHVVDKSVVLWDNTSLTDLDGLANVSVIGGALNIRGNPNLTSLGGLGPITDLVALYVYGNASLADVDLPLLKAVQRMTIGTCSFDGLDPDGDNPKLTTLDGLANLGSLTAVTIGSQSSLTSIDPLRALAMSGGYGGDEIYITFNPQLPADDVVSFIEMADPSSRAVFHCGNLGDSPTAVCGCPNPG